MKRLKILDAADYSNAQKPISKVKLPWYLKVWSELERWCIKKFKHISPYNQRIVKFYTHNYGEQGADFDFMCPHYTYDYNSCLYDDFLGACEEIGQTLQTMYGVLGNYWYDVKITLNYERQDNLLSRYNTSYSYNILKTNNPRCVEGKTTYRKNCSYLRNCNSNLVICGYHLSGNYCCIMDVLEELSNKIVVIHSHSDARAFLEIMKFLGINHIQLGNYRQYNLPAKHGRFTTKFLGYYLAKENSEIVIHRMPLSYVPAASEVLDIDEFVVRRDCKIGMKHE